jgi:hypothetical protein
LQNHSPEIYLFLHDAIEGQMTEVKVAGRRRTHLVNDLRNKRYWELRKESEDRKLWKQFINRT